MDGSDTAPAQAPPPVAGPAPLPVDYKAVSPPTPGPKGEFTPPSVIPCPIETLQPHPDYPATYPPVAVGRPTETGPRKVFYHPTPSGGQWVGGPPPGDMQENEYATNGEWGMVDWAQRANVAASVSWHGITEMPSRIGSYWWVGSGPPDPTQLPDALPGDLYLDENTGEVYQLS